MATLIHKLEGKYEILEKVREGGMGAVYRVRHRLLGEERCVKVVRPPARGEPGLRDRFLAEARVAKQLSHPNIAQIFDCTLDEDGVFFLVMEHIQGRSIEDLLRTGERFPISLALEIARQSLRAIGHVHHRNVVHRSLSPDHLMLTRDVDGRPLVKLVDFGLDPESDDDGPRADSGVFLGKFRYAAPETFDDDQAIDLKLADLYGFGLILYELLTGQFPISGSSPSSLIAGHLFRPPLDFAESDPEGRVPEGARRAVLKALAKVPVERFQDAASFAEALEKGIEVDLSSPGVERILSVTETSPGSSPKPVPAAPILPAPASVPADPMATQTMVHQVESISDAEATVRLEPVASREPAATEPTLIVEREALVAEEPAEKPAGETAEVMADPEEATVILGRVSPSPDPQSRQGEALKAVRSVQENTTIQSTPPSEAPTETDPRLLQQALEVIGQYRDEGRAGEALKELNRTLQILGPLPELQALRYELGEALLERDAEEEDTASRMFEAVRESAGEPVAEKPIPPSTQPLSPTLSEATIRSTQVAMPAAPERPEPPVASSNRGLVWIGLILVAVLAAVVFFLIRQEPINERGLAVEDVQAQSLSPGVLVLDAVPWAEIVRLEAPDSEEDPPPISPSRFTPVILNLPPGEYHLTLRYPPTGQQEELVVRIDSDQRVEERVHFESYDAKRYFEQAGW